jgi:hypothetical protein
MTYGIILVEVIVDKNNLSEKIDKFGIPLMEMARVWPKESGLDVAVVILSGESLPHGPRVKVSTIRGGRVDSKSLITVTISDEPEFIGSHDFSAKDKAKIVEFIKTNLQTLSDHYFGKITDREALLAIKKIG